MAVRKSVEDNGRRGNETEDEDDECGREKFGVEKGADEEEDEEEEYGEGECIGFCESG